MGSRFRRRPRALREARIEVEPLAPLMQPGLKHDGLNALAVYGALRKLTPQQASDERFWVHVSHLDCADYIRERWLATRPDDPGRAAARARNHSTSAGTAPIRSTASLHRGEGRRCGGAPAVTETAAGTLPEALVRER